MNHPHRRVSPSPCTVRTLQIGGIFVLGRFCEKDQKRVQKGCLKFKQIKPQKDRFLPLVMVKNRCDLCLTKHVFYVTESFAFGRAGCGTFGGAGCTGGDTFGTAFCDEICKA